MNATATLIKRRNVTLILWGNQGDCLYMVFLIWCLSSHTKQLKTIYIGFQVFHTKNHIQVLSLLSLMGTISNPNIGTSSYAIDMYFDLDEALTQPPEDHICYRGNNYSIATSTTNTLAANMPTAVGAEVNEGVICSICAEGFHHGYSDHDHSFSPLWPCLPPNFHSKLALQF